MRYHTRSQEGKNDSNTLLENNAMVENKTIKKKRNITALHAGN